jgi:hypothetical protein
MLREGGLTDAHRSHRFVFVQVPQKAGNLHTPPARENIAPGVLRRSSLGGQARGQAGDKLSRQPLGGIKTILDNFVNPTEEADNDKIPKFQGSDSVCFDLLSFFMAHHILH